MYQTYQCRRPSIWKWNMELYADNTLIGEIQYPKWDYRKANLYAASGKWWVEPGGFNEYSVYDLETDEEIAFLEGNWKMHYKLQLRHHEHLNLTLKSKWEMFNYRFVWVDEQEQEWMEFKLKMTWKGYDTSIHFDTDTFRELDPLFLAELGLYIIRLRQVQNKSA